MNLEPKVGDSPQVNSAAPAEAPPILPAASRHPLHLLWISVLPQALLLIMNLHWLWVIEGEMNEAQRVSARFLVAAQIGMMVIVGGMALVLHGFKKRVPAMLYAPLLAMSVGYLWFVLAGASQMIPDSVSTWILPPGTFLYYQFALVMPLAFFSAMHLACFESGYPRRADVVVTLLILLAIPLATWISIRFAFSLFTWPLLLAGTVVASGAMMRLIVMAYGAARRKGPIALASLTVLVALAAPIGGLLLNRRVAFPSDFQAPGVYALAMLNGLLLLLPNFRPLWLHRAVWLAQCALFPFTLYFFAVFLPFLPLSLVAMIVLGAGFLMLAPTALFILHGQRILDGF